MTENSFLRKILLPIDESQSSLMAQETTVAVAKQTEAAVTVLHVIPVFRNASDFPSRVQSEIIENTERRSEALLSQAKTLFTEESIDVTLESPRGDAAISILDHSARGYDLLVMGACGENEKDQCKLGSVTKKVTRHTHIPTLIVKRITLLSNMLVCTDGSVHSVNALALAAKLAKRMNAKLTLLNVQEGMLWNVSPRTAEEAGSRILESTLKSAGEIGVEVQTQVEYGVSSNVIIDTAESGGYDLVVFGSRGLGSAGRFLLGSVSDDVCHNAKCSVLIVPPSA